MEKKPRGKRSGITLKHVAEEAGVSIAAVSKVLHGRGTNIRVSVEKAQAIQEAAKGLNYVPNALAQSMRLGRTHTIGLIFENFGHISAGPLFYVQMLEGVMGELFPSGYRLTIFPEVSKDDSLSCTVDGSVDGLVWCKVPDEPDIHAQLLKSLVPIVALNSRPPESPEGITYVSCDNEGGSYLVAQHLAGLGHKRILFAMEETEEETPDALTRLAGFRAACRRLRIPFGDEDVVVWDKEAKDAGSWFKQLGRPHTAVYAWNEGFGATILNQLQSCGLRVPEDISVVGFDSTQYCETLSPTLTAVRQPIMEMASYACRILLAQLGRRTKMKSPDIIFPCTLDVRESTAPPRPGV